MLRHITNAIFGSSQTALEAEMATELGQILKRGTLKDKLLSAEDLAVFQEFPIPLDNKISLLISFLRDAYQLPAIVYEIQYQDDKPIINIASDLITEDNYKTVIALCARFELDVVSPINDKKRTYHPFDQFDSGIVEVIVSYMDDFSRYAFWQDPLFRDCVLIHQQDGWVKNVRELYFVNLASNFEAQVKGEFANASCFKGNSFKMTAATVCSTIGLAGISVGSYFINSISSQKETIFNKLKSIEFYPSWMKSNCVDYYYLANDVPTYCDYDERGKYAQCVEPCDKFYHLGLLMLAPGFGVAAGAILFICSLCLINDNVVHREDYLSKLRFREYSAETKQLADLLIAEAKDIIDQKLLPEMQEETERSSMLARLVQMNSSVTSIGDVLNIARGIQYNTHARVQKIMQKLRSDKVPVIEQNALSVASQTVVESSVPSEVAIDIPSDGETIRLPRPFIFARLGGFRPEVTQRLLGNEEDESLSYR